MATTRPAAWRITASTRVRRERGREVMSTGIFGTPVTESTLEAMPEYAGKPVTRKDLGEVAMKMKNAEQKDVNARTYVDNLKSRYGYGVSTLALIYNATGATLKHQADNDFRGHLGEAPYPVEIANGQWGGFLHVHSTGAATGSIGAVVYRGKGPEGDKEYEFVLGWSDPWDHNLDHSRAKTEIYEAGGFNDWNSFANRMYSSGTSSESKLGSCVSRVSIGNTTSSVFEAIISLDGQ